MLEIEETIESWNPYKIAIDLFTCAGSLFLRNCIASGPAIRIYLFEWAMISV